MNALTFLWELKGGTRNDKNHQDKEYKVSHFTSLGSVTKSSDASKFSTEPVQTFKLGWQYPFVLIKRKGFSFLSKQRLNSRINEVKNYKFKLKNHVQNYKIINLSMKRITEWRECCHLISQATLPQNMLPQLIPIYKSFLSMGQPQIPS